MKTSRLLTKAVLTAAASIAAITSCDQFFNDSRDGEISISFIEDHYLQTKASVAEIPDTNDFILDISNSKGVSLYSGPYGAAPQTVLAAAGTYTVTVRSGDFKAPSFSTPVFGDSQTVKLTAAEAVHVSLMCRQTNSGIKLETDESFLKWYPNAVLFLKSDDGKLMYSYSEKRVAYFNPGKVQLILSDGGSDQTLLSRDMAARDILTLKITASAKTGSDSAGTAGEKKNDSEGNGIGGIRITVDTTRNRTTENFAIGGGSSGKGGAKDSALGISEARKKAGLKDAWIYGYIVGGDLSSSKASFKAPFTSRTNIVVAAKSSETNRSNCMSVQLQKGDIRDKLNLVDNPDNLGHTVYLRGDVVEAYYGIPGIQNISEIDLR